MGVRAAMQGRTTLAKFEQGRVKFHVARGGTASEIRQFIKDIEDAYIALARFEFLLRRRRWLRRSFIPFELFEVGFQSTLWTTQSLLPDEWLEISSVEFSSPGAWEFFGSLNPLQQLREYLKDRHERRKDREWREESEKSKMQLENDLLQEQVRKERIAGLR